MGSIVPCLMYSVPDKDFWSLDSQGIGDNPVLNLGIEGFRDSGIKIHVESVIF